MLKRRPHRAASTGLLAFVQDRAIRVINVLALASLATAFLVRVAFATDGSSIPGASDTANLASDLCVGYLAAWVFYYLTIWRPRRDDRNRALRAAGPAAIRTSGTARGLLDGLRAIAGKPTTGPVSERQLDDLVRGLKSTDPANMVGPDRRPVTIFQMLWYYKDRAEAFIESARRLELYLDSELVVALAEIHECFLFTQLRLMIGTPVEADLHVLVPSLYDYILKCDGLLELTCERYGDVIDGAAGLNIAAVKEIKTADGPLEWRAGSACPWEPEGPRSDI